MKNPVEVIHDETGRRTTVPARSVKALEKQGWRRVDDAISDLPTHSYDQGGFVVASEPVAIHTEKNPSNQSGGWWEGDAS